MRIENAKKKLNVRCKSADSGVSVALSKTCKNHLGKTTNREIHDLEEQLDFEPDFGHEFDGSSQDQSTSQHIYSDQSTVKIFNPNNSEDIDSSFSATESTTLDYSVSNVSISHRRDMLPIPRSDAKDRREYEYLPLSYTPSISARTTLDSSSEDDSGESESERNYDDLQDLPEDQNTDQSGNRKEESSSTYSITQEEEDRLLDSDEEESQDDNNFVIQTNSIQTCRIGNAQITFPTFISASPKHQSNDLKRNKSIAKLKTFEGKKKKKKWDLPFKPEHPMTRLFLNDIGYIDVDSGESIAQSEEESDISQPQLGSLIVICNKDKITCEEPRSTSQREIISLSKSGENNFKLPLPPPKRPPTRPKRTVSESEGSSTNLQIKFSNKGHDFRKPSTFIAPKGGYSLTRNSELEDDIVNDKDDTISILASTIGGDNVNDVANLEELEDSFSSDQTIPFPTSKNSSYLENRVKQWVENMGNPQTSMSNLEPNINKSFGLNHPSSNLNIQHPNLYQLNPNSNRLNPNINQLNSNLNQLNPNLNHLNPILNQLINPNLNRLNPNIIQLNSNLNQLNPKLNQQNPNSNQLNPNLRRLSPTLNSTEVQPKSRGSGVTLMSSVVAKGHPRINFRDVPNVFSGLCYHYYFSLNCAKLNCPLAHIINVDKFAHKIKRVDPKDAFNYFQLAMRFEKLFKEIYPSFVKAFGALKMQNELITCIKNFLEMKNFDSTEAIALVVKSLEESGLSFQDAIDMISFNIGFLEHPVLADIILDLITRAYDISENWGVIKRISKARGKIKPSIVSRIFLSMVNVYPVNKELCCEIYNVIVKNNMTDLSQINEDVLIPVRTLVDFQDPVGVAKPATVTSVHVSQSQSSAPPNPHEVLAAHIDHKLLKERALYEREVQGTTVRTRVDREPFVMRNCNFESQRNSSDNRSHSSDSDDRYFQPSPRLSPYPMDYGSPSNSADNKNFRSNGFSLSTVSIPDNPFQLETTVDVDAALRFEPPSEISGYVPENIRNRRRSEPQEVEVTLTPSRPIFGNPHYRSNFAFDKSLHNLLPDSFEHVNINEKDVAKLNSVIKSQNGVEFYELLQYYKDPPTLQNFITMTIANLKSSNNSIYDTLISFIRSFRSINPDYAKDRIIKGIIEVIVLNALFEIEKKGQFNHARSLLELFCDWDSLVSSKLFQIFSKRKVTHMGRYIFLAKMFSKAKDFHFTYEILQSPNLKLLGSTDNWPYFCNSPVDLDCRNAVLKDFFQYGQRYYPIGLADMYRKVYKFGGIYGFDAGVHFNPILISMINEQQTPFLKHFLPDIDVYYKVMEKNVLRAFTILLADQLNQDNLFRLYEFCCKRQIYTQFLGGESNITVRNNMFNVELHLILNYYFYKISETRQLPTGDVTIHIKLLENKPLFPKMLQKCIRSIKEVNIIVKKILNDHFSIATLEESNEQLTAIKIPHKHIKKWRECNQRWFTVYS